MTEFKCVPAVPTEAMIDAAIQSGYGCGRGMFKRAFTAAVQSSQAHDGEGVAPVCNARLKKPARVGATRFSIGVPERLVIDRAQREEEWHVNPELKDVDYVALGQLLNPQNTAPPRVVDWLPIESRPTDDNRTFMVLMPTKECGQVAVQVSVFEGRIYPDVMEHVIDFDDAISIATHWKECDPLPKAPEAK